MHKLQYNATVPQDQYDPFGRGDRYAFLSGQYRPPQQVIIKIYRTAAIHLISDQTAIRRCFTPVGNEQITGVGLLIGGYQIQRLFVGAVNAPRAQPQAQIVQSGRQITGQRQDQQEQYQSNDPNRAKLFPFFHLPSSTLFFLILTQAAQDVQTVIRQKHGRQTCVFGSQEILWKPQA